MSWTEIDILTNPSDVDGEQFIYPNSKNTAYRGNVTADNIRAARSRIISVDMVEVSTNSTDTVDGGLMGSTWVTIPDIGTDTGITPILRATVEAKVSSGTGTIWIRDFATTTEGTKPTTTSTSYEWVTSILTIDSGWYDSTRFITLRAYHSAGGAELTYTQAVLALTWNLVY